MTEFFSRYVFGVFTFSFCYCFHEGFILKIILVSRFLPFSCITYLLKVFKSDTGIFHHSCAVPLLKWFMCSVFTGRQHKCCWILLLHWIQFCLLWTLSKSMFFELPGLVPLVLYLIRSVSAEVSLDYISGIRFRCSFFWLWEYQYIVHGFDSDSIAQFPGMICSVSTEGSLNRIDQSI